MRGAGLKSLKAALFALVMLASGAVAQGPYGPPSGPPDGPPPPAPRRELNFPPPPTPLTQEYVSQKFIYSLLAGQLDTLKALFAPDVREYVTEPVMERLRSQFNWFYGIIGGEFEEFFNSQQDSSFFREYRLANESNDRSPLIVIQVVFPDSAQTELIGAQVKNFLGGNEKRLAGEQTWTIKGQNYDLHSIILAQLDTGSVMAIQFYDESPDTLSREMVSRIGVPLIKEAFARGYVDSARAVLEGKQLLDRVGVVFIRRDKREGMLHARIGFGPEDYGVFPDASKPKKAKTTSKKKKAPAKK
jgi:hypothetical protein